MSSRASSSVFVGQRHELAVIDQHLADLKDGSGGFLMISGEAGIGKSRLVEELIDRVDDDRSQVLLGRCIQFGDAVLPVAPVLDILEELRAKLSPGESESVLGPARDDLARLLPGLEVGPSSSIEPLDGRRLLEVVHRVLRRLSDRRPVVVVFEDLHWADRTTRDLVGYLGVALRAAPVLLWSRIALTSFIADILSCRLWRIFSVRCVPSASISIRSTSMRSPSWLD